MLHLAGFFKYEDCIDLELKNDAESKKENEGYIENRPLPRLEDPPKEYPEDYYDNTKTGIIDIEATKGRIESLRKELERVKEQGDGDK